MISRNLPKNLIIKCCRQWIVHITLHDSTLPTCLWDCIFCNSPCIFVSTTICMINFYKCIILSHLKCISFQVSLFILFPKMSLGYSKYVFNGFLYSILALTWAVGGSTLANESKSPSIQLPTKAIYIIIPCLYTIIGGYKQNMCLKISYSHDIFHDFIFHDLSYFRQMLASTLLYMCSYKKRGFLQCLSKSYLYVYVYLTQNESFLP